MNNADVQLSVVIEEFAANGEYQNAVSSILRIMKYYKFYGDEEEARNILNETLFKILDGERKWDPQKYPDINKYILLCAKSFIRNEQKKFYNKKSEPYEENEDDDDEFKNFKPPNYFSKNDYHFLDDMIVKETEQKIEKLLEHDDDALLIYYERVDGSTNLEIAKSLGISVSSVENGLKRIRRKLEAFQLQN